MSIILDQFRRLFGDSGPSLDHSANPLLTENSSKFSTAFFIDLTRRRYTHMDKTCEHLVGYSSNYLLEGGLESWIDIWKPEHVEIYCNKLLPTIGTQLAQADPVRRHNYVFSRNYSVRSKQGEFRTIFERVTFLYHPSSAAPVAITGFGSDITHFADAGKTIHTVEDFTSSGRERLVYKEVFFHEADKSSLTKKELEVLKWVTEGYTSKQIADILGLSINTVNNHRKSILEKTGCFNSAGLVAHAISNKLI